MKGKLVKLILKVVLPGRVRYYIVRAIDARITFLMTDKSTNPYREADIKFYESFINLFHQ